MYEMKRLIRNNLKNFILIGTLVDVTKDYGNETFINSIIKYDDLKFILIFALVIIYLAESVTFFMKGGIVKSEKHYKYL